VVVEVTVVDIAAEATIVHSVKRAGSFYSQLKKTPQGVFFISN